MQRLASPLVAVALLLAACVPPPPRTVSLRVQGNVPDASVTVDDQYLGALAYVASKGVALPPGPHRITVEKAGWFPWDRLVEAKDEPVVLQIVLTKIPD